MNNKNNSLPKFVVFLISVFFVLDNCWALMITARTTPEVLVLFSTDPIATTRGKVVDPLRIVVAAMREAVRPCGSGILSLGEGRSTFIYNLLSDRQHNMQFTDGPQQSPEQNPASYLNGHDINFPIPLSTATKGCGLEGIHAVDVAYPRHNSKGIVTDLREASTGYIMSQDAYDPRVLPWIKEFPLNYHSQLFKELDLRGEGGVRLRFPVILSTFALSYHIGKEGVDITQTLDKVLDHLSPGGVLIMTPIPCVNGTVPVSMERYYKRLRELVKSNVVSDFNILDKNACIGPRIPAPDSVLVVIKSSSTAGGAEAAPIH